MSDRLTTVPPRWSIDIGGAGPLYHRLRQRLKRQSSRVNSMEGDPLHPERDLAEHVQVSRVTVRKAFDHLVHDGFLVRRPGSGTFVAGSAVRVDQPLSPANILTGGVSGPESIVVS
ncbi:GntR family transcriptional regulator [Rhizobium laguerreae]|uniref:GntR family transcriptional regulator n=1 Tax=Rhizobium laguerreae TaxID=1076926 RepID=UPI001C902E67|nr:GntR family transcriptional regulator [Rhizobium laguerreae]MBY3390250.1 GntR family transcriptional regulator [Rhizobium laguerreae]MBY3403914.1 GntR family transcriptional regulator [Rhizobium laguerreae]MBY3410852.1 GntR family transcriptional regulator [Rhizobium laguerreae]